MCSYKMASCILILGTLCTSAIVATGRSLYVTNVFSDTTNNGRINHLVVHKTTGKLYVGAVNKLYQLSSTLVLEKAVTTGPKNDSPNCSPSQPCQDRKFTNAVNKALAISYKTQRLIACTNINQGYCDKRHLGDITQADPPIFKQLVPYDSNSSTVLFIAPGPPNPPTTHVLYIGASRSTVGLDAYRDLVPTLSSRNLDTFKIAKSGLVYATKVKLETQQKNTFRVNYIYGFSSDGFSYFLTVQKEAVHSTNYVTRLVRVCQNDVNYYSYTEIPIECSRNGKKYNIVRAAHVTRPGAKLAIHLGLPHLPPLSEKEDVLFATFMKSHPQSLKLTNESALCVYSLQDIRRKFTENIQQCFRGVGNTGPAHIASQIPCVKTEFHTSDNYCGEHDFNYPIEGTNAMSKNAVLTWANNRITSIAVSVTQEYTVAFLGNEQGRLKKVVIENNTNAMEYETIRIDSAPIIQDMGFAHGHTHLYVATKKKVYRVKVQECKQYKTCLQCLGAKDPYCGWCALENRCTMRDACQASTDHTRWIPYAGAQCTNITQIIPEKVQIEKSRTIKLTLKIQNLPVLSDGSYQCAFTGYGVTRTTGAQRVPRNSQSHIRCETPYPNLLPPIPTGQDHIVMKLSIRLNNKNFVSRDFVFFDCGIHNSCTRCTKSAYPCTWCVKKHLCTSNKELCGGDVLVTGRNVKGLSDTPGPQFCPRIEKSVTEILVPAGTPMQVTTRALNLQSFQTNFKCKFTINGVKTVRATVSNTGGIEQIVCQSLRFNYTGMTPNRNVPFKITWGTPSKNMLDNPDDIQVKVYKCNAMASNCGECLTQKETFSCGWCKGPNPSCTIQNQCRGQQWLDRHQPCPDPTIKQFWPALGPTKGGTNLTITGTNLGKAFEDIEHGIYVAREKCMPIRSLYVPASRIVCVTGPVQHVTAGSVRISVQNQYSAVSSSQYDYVEPKILGIQPEKGPMSGGTRITIRGRNMDAGTKITARVLNLPCRVIGKRNDAAICVTSRLPPSRPTKGAITMEFDRATVSSEATYTYVQDPTIENVSPRKGILSGGVNQKVKGERLDAIREPKMYARVNGRNYYGPCVVDSPVQMTCKSPNISPANYKINPEKPLELTFGFIMDGVKPLQNMTSLGSTKQFKMYPDPEFDKFENNVKYFQPKNEYLTINGRHLNLALNKEDVTVKIGNAYCNVTSMAKTQLTCRPPAGDSDKVGTDPEVKVYLGINKTYDIGILHYERPESGLSFPAIVGIAAGGGILIIIIIVIIIAYRRKSQESNRVMKRMQNQMDVLESRVAKECKEAFAELQTDMTELTSDLGGLAGIPFRDYRSFCMRVLFPNVIEDEHPVTRHFEVDYSRRDSVGRGLRGFNQLILNKTFLLLFIRTLESHSEFSMRERVNVASLISVALQNKMEYHTDILKTLLAELIEKTLEGRNHPKLLLRRTESVAEKMLTNWFTFLLYKFLKECAGEPLFMLFRAIKQQVDKGPVDAVTSEAKYSLSEDKLIRQQIDYSSRTIYVLDPDVQYGAQEHAVKVLDCDTISQVKEKILDAIYKNAPFSSRPDKDDLDLVVDAKNVVLNLPEWRTGRQGRLALSDEDVSTKTEGEFKKLNTLGHYRVPDGAQMALVPRQSSMYNLSTGSDRSGSHYRDRYVDLYGLAGSPSMTRSLSPSDRIDLDTGGTRYYHLVKQHDPDVQKEGDRGSKMVSEIYLTRLLATKGTLQQFVDDLFETIFSTAHRGSALPLAIKYMFDFLDDQALHHGITDPEVVHTWKSNSLPLRFWVNVVKNPNFVFDISKSNIVDSCLSVVAQTFMDSCSMSEHRLGKDSPSSKLLYAKDIPKYKKWVERYYLDIKMMPAISDQDMNAMLTEESRLHYTEFHADAALNELYQYVVRYNDELMNTLEEDEFARNYRLAYKLEQVHTAMESEV